MLDQLPSVHFPSQKKHDEPQNGKPVTQNTLALLEIQRGTRAFCCFSWNTCPHILFMKKLERLMSKSFERLIQMNGCQMAWLIMVRMISFLNGDIKKVTSCNNV